MKPCIKRVRFSRILWVCFTARGYGFGEGFGCSPRAAYNEWKKTPDGRRYGQ